MSEYVELYCVDCKEGSGDGINHGEDTLRRFLEFRRGITLLVKNNFTVSMDPWQGNYASFMYKHEGHVLHVLGEYGDVYATDDPSGSTPTQGEDENIK